MLIHYGALAAILAFVNWPSGWVFADMHMGWWPVAAIAALLAYYVVVYRVILAVPPPGTIVPRYQAPDDASPAILRFLQRKTFDEKAFAATVLDLAARGYMEVRGGQNEPYTFSRASADESSLPTDEKMLARALFHDAAVLRIDLSHSAMIERAKKTMAKCVESLAAPYFHPNTRYFGGSVALTVTVLLALVAHSPFPGVVLFACVALALFGSIMTVAWTSVVRDLRQSLQRRSSFGILMAITGSVGIVPPFILFCACVLIMVLLAWHTSIVFVLFLLAAVVINVAAFRNRQVPTRRGRQLLDEAEGFRQFLATVEADQLDRLSDGVTAPEMISKMLPYAVAFDLDHRWASQRFAHAFGFAGGEYVSGKHAEIGNVLPQGMKLPNPFDLLSIASFLAEVNPQIKDAPSQAGGSSPHANLQEILRALAGRSSQGKPQAAPKPGMSTGSQPAALDSSRERAASRAKTQQP